jgi:hypothetical protein
VKIKLRIINRKGLLTKDAKEWKNLKYNKIDMSKASLYKKQLYKENKGNLNTMINFILYFSFRKEKKTYFKGKKSLIINIKLLK